MGNKAGTRSGTNQEPWAPPRGIRYKFNPGRPTKPFQLIWQDAGQEKTQSFADAAARESSARALASKRKEFGTEILSFDPREWRTWQLFKERVAGADPLIVAQEWIASRQGRGLVASGLTVKDAVNRYYKARKEEHLSPDTYRHIKSHLLDRFVPAYGSLPLAALTPDLIREWLDKLKSKRGSGVIGPVARRHHQKNLKTFLDYCVRATWIAHNPTDLLGMPKIPEKDPIPLTLEEARHLFAVNAGQRVIGRMALEAFGGQRNSLAGRIQKDDVKIPTKGLRLRGPIHKSGKWSYRQGFPENLWKWIAHAPATCWDMAELEYRKEKREAFVRADIGPSKNRLRKTFISAHLAAYKDPPRTGYLAQHKNVSTTAIYEGVMDENAAKLYFEIVPQP